MLTRVLHVVHELSVLPIKLSVAYYFFLSVVAILYEIADLNLRENVKNYRSIGKDPSIISFNLTVA